LPLLLAPGGNGAICPSAHVAAVHANVIAATAPAVIFIPTFLGHSSFMSSSTLAMV
jgi:hypothetical protein